jgi:hypothetical protein
MSVNQKSGRKRLLKSDTLVRLIKNFLKTWEKNILKVEEKTGRDIFEVKAYSNLRF